MLLLVKYGVSIDIFANDLDYNTIMKNISIMVPNVDVTAEDTII